MPKVDNQLLWELLVNEFHRFTFSLYSKRSSHSLSTLHDFIDRVGVVGTKNVFRAYLEVLQHLLVRRNRTCR